MTEISRSFDWSVPAGEGMTHIPLPFDQRAVFGQARPPVVVTLDGYSYRSTIAIMRGVTFVPLRRSHREAADIVPGQIVAVTLTLDTAPRVVELSADVAAAVEAAGLRESWDRLSYTDRREYAEAIDSAKRAETRQKRIAGLLVALAP